MSEDPCELLRNLASNLAYQPLIVFKCIACLLGAFGVGYQWWKQGVSFLVHNNTKIVFNFYYALNVCIATIFALFYAFELVRLQLECAVVTFRTVLLTKGIGICAVVSAHYVFMIISIERLYSSLYPAHFEKNSSKRLALFLAISVILLSWYFTMSRLSSGFSLLGDNVMVAVMEERIAENANTFAELVFVGAIANTFSLVVFGADIYLNFIRKTSTVNPSLSISYQRSENRRILLIILPIETIETLLGFVTISALILQEKVIDTEKPIDRIVHAEMFTFPPLFPLILAIIIERLVARRVRTPVTNTDTEVNYFESLRRAWDV